jgi:putative phosphotransacetylase
MTPEEIQALASRIADLLARQQWVPTPVRPEPPGGPSPGALPPWAGAAQSLSDVAPVPGRKTRPGRHRPAYDALTAAVRGAAAGRAPAPMPGGSPSPAAPAPTSVSDRRIPIGISNRHIHITVQDFERLFGAGTRPVPDRPITQPGQFAARERVTVVGPAGSIEGVRIVGPTRSSTQVELAASDCRTLGVDAPIRGSGDIAGSAAARLDGPAGSVDLAEGTIIAARHIHVAPGDAAALGVSDGDRVSVVVGTGDRRTTLHDMLIRSGETHATELHLDHDEARAFNVRTGDRALIVGHPRKASGQPRRRSARRTLVTERVVSRFLADGQTLCDYGDYVVTPAARDRAKSLGIWRDR